MVAKWLFGREKRTSTGAKAPAVPPGVRVYAIGDVHGRYDLLDDLLQRIEADAARGSQLQTLLIMLGDYVDRGLHSRAVVERLLRGPLPGTRATFLKGNHEQALLEFLDDPGFGQVWRNFGGLETLFSYGVEDASRLATREDFARAQSQFKALLPPEHLVFLKNLKLMSTVGDYCFVHAGVRPGVALDRQVEQDLLWVRDVFLDSDDDFGRVVVHGHTPEAEPVVRPNRIGIDTGAYMTGVLTAVALEGSERRFLTAQA